MEFIKNLNWSDPLDYLTSLENSQADFVLLNSSYISDFSGRYSYLAYEPVKQIKSSNLDLLAKNLSNDKNYLDNSWFGFLGYGLKNSLEELSNDSDFFINLDDLHFVNFAKIILFDHAKKEISFYSSSDKEAIWPIVKNSQQDSAAWSVDNLRSNMTKEQYLDKVHQIKELIEAGDIYQANLTRKFYGNIKGHNPVSIFKKLCRISPSPFAALMHLDGKYIISSSPESFVKVDAEKNIVTRPIKGTAKKYDDPVKDEISKQGLINSIKDKAENLMITDLSRNDLSRTCEIGSVVTKDLFDVTSYQNIHHMSSTISGKIKREYSTLDAIKLAFPPGSMTGAPKIRAMQICSDLEKVKRGVYSGALGYFGGDGSCDLSVVIRTIIIENDKFEFQVGGAIVHDSSAISEFEETMIKAKSVAHALNIDVDGLKRL